MYCISSRTTINKNCYTPYFLLLETLRPWRVVLKKVNICLVSSSLIRSLSGSVPLSSLYLSLSIAYSLSSLAPSNYSFSPICSPVWCMFNGSVPDLNFVVSCLTVLCNTVFPFKYSLIKWLQSHPSLACLQKNWDRPADLTPFDIFIQFFFTNWNFCFIWLISFFFLKE